MNGWCISGVFVQDKPWVFGHLVQLQRRLGKDCFPLIDQTFYADSREMVSFFQHIYKFTRNSSNTAFCYLVFVGTT